jgi:site-specific recombinase XerD
MPTFKVTAEIGQQIILYKRFMLDNEYTQQTTIGYSTYLSRFLRRPQCAQTPQLQKGISDFLEFERTNSPQTYKGCRAALYLYFKMVEGKHYPKRQAKESSPGIESVVRQFYDYSVDIKRIRPASALREIARVRNFMEYINNSESVLLENITANEVREYVVKCLAHMTDSSKGREITALRNFFRFRKFNGEPVHESIFMLPLSPAVWKNSAFPTVMNEEVFNSLHEVPDRSTPAGKRDRCIILCFTELALRCIEVAALTMDDFNWREGFVTIRNTKNNEDRKLPVSEKLAQAAIEYLSEARPQTTDRTLFVRFKHTCGEPMGAGQIRGVVRRVYAKSGADIKPTGPHILRRTAGSRIYNSGNSLKMTADILGHKSLDSTVHYVKADITGLRQVAAPWSYTAVKAGDCDA